MAREDNYAVGRFGRRSFDSPEIPYFEIYSTSFLWILGGFYW